MYPAIGTTAFSTKDNVYSTSLVKSYVEEYLQKLSLFNLDILNITAKLIEKKNRKGLLIMEIIYRQDFL
ncbi:unknown [Firmicutes bacterium CAG:582]|nr:unknown [Firmicutes bacterium CAG:582]